MSRQFLDRCLFSINELLKTCGHFSYQTKRDYRLGLKAMTKLLHNGGYPISNIRDLKQKHVTYLLKSWQQQGLSIATIKNRLAQLRFVARYYHKAILADKNNQLGIANRAYRSEINKAITKLDLSLIEDPYLRYSIRLQQAFGLRRQEAIKFNAAYADHGEIIRLKGSWTKGGIPRLIPVCSDEQRQLLAEIKAFTSKDSLIPADKTYAQQFKHYEKALAQAGYKNLHGLRHAYAQRRYVELTHEYNSGKGWLPPYQGGKQRHEMTILEQRIDIKVRLKIAEELGHSRRSIVSIYCG